jgi:hypothetical protein
MVAGFIEKHGLWSAEQQRQATALAARAEKDNFKLSRLTWADPHEHRVRRSSRCQRS